MRTLTITSTNGTSITIGKTNPYILQKLEGLGIPNNTSESLKSPNQDGTSYVQTLLESREIELEFGILIAGFENQFALREAVCRTLNPKYELDILYTYPGGVKRITGHLAGPVAFPKGDDIGYQKAVCTLECNNPFWRDENPTGEILAVSAPAFRFPLIFNPEIEFSVILNKTITIVNVGHVPTPINIKFQGPALNPVITNETAGEFMKVNKGLLEGEVLEINTQFGNKYVRIDGVNAFGFIDTSSTFFSLQPGDNIITYDADSGSDSAEVILRYSNLYTGV